jgi:NodT family efflux transporter outer membrane factor (OMF) lipoprotein
VRRDIERSRGLADAQREELAATRLVLAGNAVAGAIAIASLGEQREALAEQVRADDERAALLSAREEAGRAARTDVLAARLDAERSRAQLPALEQQLAAARNALAVTCGQLPAEWESPDFTLEELQLPRPVPGEIPSELVHRRPDILAAEQRLHAANAQIGVATAALYPRLDITGALGVKLEGGGGVAAAVGGQLIEPLVHGGALRAARRGAIEAHAAAFADYRATVLAGFQQVADALLALAHDAQAHEAAARALDIASQALALEQTRYDAGKVDALAVLEARRSLGQVRGELARARAQHLADAATLFVAMGGGAR